LVLSRFRDEKMTQTGVPIRVWVSLRTELARTGALKVMVWKSLPWLPTVLFGRFTVKSVMSLGWVTLTLTLSSRLYLRSFELRREILNPPLMIRKQYVFACGDWTVDVPQSEGNCLAAGDNSRKCICYSYHSQHIIVDTDGPGPKVTPGRTHGRGVEVLQGAARGHRRGLEQYNCADQDIGGGPECNCQLVFNEDHICGEHSGDRGKGRRDDVGVDVDGLGLEGGAEAASSAFLDQRRVRIRR
jgi:hypothetical protein